MRNVLRREVQVLGLLTAMVLGWSLPAAAIELTAVDYFRVPVVDEYGRVQVNLKDKEDPTKFNSGSTAELTFEYVVEIENCEDKKALVELELSPNEQFLKYIVGKPKVTLEKGPHEVPAKSKVEIPASITFCAAPTIAAANVLTASAAVKMWICRTTLKWDLERYPWVQPEDASQTWRDSIHSVFVSPQEILKKEFCGPGCRVPAKQRAERTWPLKTQRLYIAKVPKGHDAVVWHLGTGTHHGVPLGGTYTRYPEGSTVETAHSVRTPVSEKGASIQVENLRGEVKKFDIAEDEAWIMVTSGDVGYSEVIAVDPKEDDPRKDKVFDYVKWIEQFDGSDRKSGDDCKFKTGEGTTLVDTYKTVPSGALASLLSCDENNVVVQVANTGKFGKLFDVKVIGHCPDHTAALKGIEETTTTGDGDSDSVGREVEHGPCSEAAFAKTRILASGEQATFSLQGNCVRCPRFQATVRYETEVLTETGKILRAKACPIKLQNP